jgi:hypothetical protein
METRFEIQTLTSQLLSLYYLFGPFERLNLSIFERAELQEHSGMVLRMRKGSKSPMLTLDGLALVCCSAQL